MLKVASGGKSFWFLPGAELAEKLGYVDQANEDLLKVAFGKDAKNKQGEITKDVVPSQFAGKAIPALTEAEQDLPSDVLDSLASVPLEQALSTPTGLGIILRPREFQRIILIQLNMRPVADQMDALGAVFPSSSMSESMRMGPEFFHAALARMLLPFLMERSLLGPYIEKRVVLPAAATSSKHVKTSSLSSDLLHKIGAAYNGYRNGVMDLVANAQVLAASTAITDGHHKIAHASVEQVWTPLSAAYISRAYFNELAP